MRERQEEQIWRKLHRRQTVVLVSFLLLWVLILGRLAQIQLFRRSRYVRIAERQYTSIIKVEADRGLIRDRSGRPLVLNRTTFSLAADPKVVEQPSETAAEVSKIVRISRTRLLRALTQKNTRFVWLAHGLTRQQASRLRALEIPGLRIVRGTRRAYPHGSLASQVLGFVGRDFRGLSGIELAFDAELRGKPGLAYLQRDARRGSYLEVSYPSREAKAGNDVVLTLDYTIQEIVEEELERTVEQYRAKDGTVVVVRPSTGEIVAVASMPSFDPSRAERFAPERWKVRAITDTYEPGSTFKLITMSAVLRTGLRRPDDVIDCRGGRMLYRGKWFRDTRPHGRLSVEQVFEVSSNVGTAQLGLELKPVDLYAMARDYGLGTKTGIELTGEAEGFLKHPSRWSGLTPAMMAIGYEVAVTPLQMAMAYAAVANDGILMKPHIVREVRDHSGHVLKKTKPEAVRRVLTEAEVAELKQMLRGVVERGTGRNAAIPGVAVFGKTGTAQKFDPKIGRYVSSRHVASFIGFCESPRDTLLVAVLIDEPKGAYYGGSVAAPTFRRILKRVLRVGEDWQPPTHIVKVGREEQGAQRDTTRTSTPAPKTVVLPDVTNRRVDVAERLLREIGLKVETQEKGMLVARQEPAAGRTVPVGTQVRLTLYSPSGNGGITVAMPDLVGRSLREAIGLLASRGLTAEVVGSGTVVAQEPEAGRAVERGHRCRLRCSPRKPVVAGVPSTN